MVNIFIRNRIYEIYYLVLTETRMKQHGLAFISVRLGSRMGQVTVGEIGTQIHLLRAFRTVGSPTALQLMEEIVLMDSGVYEQHPEKDIGKLISIKI